MRLRRRSVTEEKAPGSARAFAVTGRTATASPRVKAHLAGAFYVMAVLAAASGEGFLHGRLAFGVGLIAVACFVVVTFALYALFKAVSRPIALLAASSNLLGLSFEALRLQPGGANIALIFHGLYCVLIGLLIARSGCLPRVLAAAIIIGGLAWLTDISIPLTNHLAPYNIVVGFLGEGLPMLWLLITGVNPQRWYDRAHIA